jgi:radical SAM superfamily enzyme YgiQ (UPF0313 family)
LTAKLDILFVAPGDRSETYQALGDEFSAVEPPVFARLFAHHARMQGLSVAILDVPALNISATEAAKRIHEDYDPRLVVLVVYGFQPSASTQNMTSARRIAAGVKQHDPTRAVAMTGTHPAALPEQTMLDEPIDFVIDREGPLTIVRLAQGLKAGASDWSSVASLWWRDKHGLIRRPTSTEPLVEDLDKDMPPAGWDLLDMSKYRAHNWHCFDHIDARTPYASVHTSLGCPYKCNFCCINAPFGKSSYRMWSPEAVVGEIDFLVQEHGVKNIKFVDEMFVLNRRHVLGICDLLIERKYDLNIWAYARVDTVKDEFLEKLRKAGIRWLALGIESANSTVRDGAEKSLKDDSIVGICDKIRSHGIYVLANFIFGLPDDTQASMQQTLDLALEINAEFANFYSAMAYPGSGLYRLARDQELALPREWHHYSQHGYETLPLANKQLSAGEILAMRDRAFQEYFASPRYRQMIRQKFGQPVVDHLDRMRSVPLRRKLLDAA